MKSDKSKKSHKIETKYAKVSRQEGVKTYDNCPMCRLLRSKEGSLMRKEFFDGVTEGATLHGCAEIMNEIKMRWLSHEVSKIVRERDRENTPPEEINGFKIPKWWECQWRRIGCQKKSCPFCGRLQRLMRELPTEGDESGDHPFRVLEYQAKDFGIPKEYLPQNYEREITEDDFDDEGKLISDIEDEGDDALPEPEKFLLYRRARWWFAPLGAYIAGAESKKEKWAESDAAQDLMWYGTMLSSKIYRQLCTRYEAAHAAREERKNVLEFSRIELGYTGYVLREIVSIIEKALKELSAKSEMHSLEEVESKFGRLKPSILEASRNDLSDV